MSNHEEWARYGITALECQAVQPKLDELFARAKARFFAKWDVDGRWQIVAGRRKGFKGETGYCSSKERRLYIDPRGVRGMLEDGLLALIIHEMCHDVATPHHTERWVKRMEEAAQAAESYSESELASQIRASAYAAIPSEKLWAAKWLQLLHPKSRWD